MLLTTEIDVNVNGKNAKYYEDLGYYVPKTLNNKGKYVYCIGEKIKIKIQDLAKKSHLRVLVQCDNCGKIFERQYCDYTTRHEKHTKDYCVDCKHIGQQQTNIKKYGVPHILQNEECMKKFKKTMVERYGADNAMGVQKLKEKQQEVLFNKYGTKVPCKNKEIQQKVVETNKIKYGVDYPLRLEETKKKTKDTWKKKYGSVEAFYKYQKERALETRENNKFTYSGNSKKNVPASSQQRYLQKLYGGVLNYPVSYYFVDIYIADKKLCIEFDGGGHDLSVKIGKLTQKEFNRKQVARSKVIQSHGIRTIRIISPTDKLPSDEILLQMLHEALEYFNATNHTWRNYYVEEGVFRDAEHKDGAKYDYGTLWNAKVLANQNKSA